MDQSTPRRAPGSVEREIVAVTPTKGRLLALVQSKG
jgi:hypothetical protein